MIQERAANANISYVSYEDLEAVPTNIDRTALLQQILIKFESKGWKDNVEAVDAIRSINKSYPVDMNMVCKTYWRYIIECLNSVRSAVSKSALIFVTELFMQSKGMKLDDQIILDLVPILLMKCYNEKCFLKVEAQRGIDLVVSNCVYDSTLIAFCRECNSKHATIAELSTKVIAKLIGFIGIELPKLQPVTFKELFVTLARVRYADSGHGRQKTGHG